jgi:hypothetical protein
MPQLIGLLTQFSKPSGTDSWCAPILSLRSPVVEIHWRWHVTNLSLRLYFLFQLWDPYFFLSLVNFSNAKIHNLLNLFKLCNHCSKLHNCSCSEPVIFNFRNHRSIYGFYYKQEFISLV